jgi:hypothetical protein
MTHMYKWNSTNLENIYIIIQIIIHIMDTDVLYEFHTYKACFTYQLHLVDWYSNQYIRVGYFACDVDNGGTYLLTISHKYM